MKKLVLLFLLSAAVQVNAGGYGGVGIGGINRTDVSTWPEASDDEGNVIAFKIHGGYAFTDHWALNCGVMKWSHLDQKGSDSTSRYEVRLSNHDFFLAPEFKVDPRWFIPLKFSAGVVYSEVEMRVKESFFGLAPEGEVKVSDSSEGLLLAFGLEVFKSSHVSGAVNFHYIARGEFFKKSNKPFDMTTVGASFDLAFF